MSGNVAVLGNIKKLFMSERITRERAIMLLKSRTAYYDKEIVKIIDEWERQKNENRT